MKPPKPKPIKPQTRWAIADTEGVVVWIADPKRNTRGAARARLHVFYFGRVDCYVARILIKEAK